MAKKKEPVVDGLTPKLQAKYSAAIRRVWAWSSMRRTAIKRATNEMGFTVCEACLAVSAKVHVDHIIPCGSIMSDGFLERLNVCSKGLQILCPKCHRDKTKKDKSNAR